MSRIGRKPITVPDGVTVTIEPELVSVKGPKGELSERISRDITVVQDDAVLTVSRPTDRGEHRALHGLTRSLVANMVIGVTNGYEKTLDIQGVGYRAALKGRDLELALGYSHPVSVAAPEGIEYLKKSGMNLHIVTASVDERLNEHAFIVPGLGDAGDRQFGPPN